MRKKLFIIGLPLALAVCISVYAKDGDKEGSLTITGIPAEYNGKFASFSHKMGSTGEGGSKVNLIASTADTNKLLSTVKGVVIANGEVKLLLFKTIPFVGGLTAYSDSKTVRVELCIRDTEESSQKSPNQNVEPDFIFPSITFKNGAAAVKLNDAFKVGLLTITGVPSNYEISDVTSDANIRFTRPDEKKKGTTYTHDTKGKIKNGTLTVKYYRDEENNYMPYTGIADITVAMKYRYDSSVTVIGGSREESHKILFKAQMTNDNAALDFAEGIKQ
jgi:hypothetical protein